MCWTAARTFKSARQPRAPDFACSPNVDLTTSAITSVTGQWSVTLSAPCIYAEQSASCWIDVYCIHNAIVRPQSTVEYTRSPVEANSVVVTICIVRVILAGCVHSSVNKPGANGRVGYDSLTHSRLYCRDRQKK